MKILKDHQKKVVNYISKNENRGILIIHDTGTGKTLTGVASIFEILKKNKKNVIIITPVTLTENWKKEIIDFNGSIPTNFTFLTFQSLAKINIGEVCLDSIIIIDEVHNLRTPVEAFFLNVKGITKYILENEIKKFPMYELALQPGEKTKKLTPDLANLFELYNIPKYIVSIPKKGIYAYYNMLCALNAFKLLLLTATPIINGYKDLDNIFKMFYKIPNMASINELEAIIVKFKIPISYYFINKTPENGYPFYNIFRISVPMTEEEKLIYYKFEKNIKLNLTAMNELRIKANTEVALEFYSPKIRYILDRLKKKYLKTLIYSFFIDKGMDPVYKMLIEKGSLKKEEVFMITGSTKIEQRQKIVDEFNKLPTGVMIISSAGREGIDLKGVRYVFLLEPGWNDSSDHQALSRAVRYKSHAHLPLDEQKVDVFRLMLKGTIDDFLFNRFVVPKKIKSETFMKLCKKYSI